MFSFSSLLIITCYQSNALAAFTQPIAQSKSRSRGSYNLGEALTREEVLLMVSVASFSILLRRTSQVGISLMIPMT